MSQRNWMHWTLRREADGLAWLEIDCAGAAANTLSAEVMAEFSQVLDELDRQPPAALVIASEEAATARGLPVLATIEGYAAHGEQPEWFTIAPVGATRCLLEKLGWGAEDVDVYEVNEAFAVVPMALMEELSLAPERVNVFGGAVALGHPIGASGARILVTLLSAMRSRGARRGVASICIGGGEALAMGLAAA